MEQNTTLIVVSHTHWDREWYLTFQQFRRKLVRLIDNLLDTLCVDTDPGYRYFMLDGQTIVLEDYLDIRPEREADLRRHIRAGRILVGPWYILPDEFLVSPEATVRNLMLGLRQARSWTDAAQPMDIGYLPDPFGHIAQMPQILRGFGIEAACLWRGVPGDTPASEFRWQAPDGSTVLVLWTPNGYGNAAHLPLDPPALRARVEAIIAGLRPLAATDHLLLMNGTDHQEAQAGLPAALVAAAAELDGVNIVHGTLPQYRDAVLAANPDLSTVTGELRSGERAPLLPGVLSARAWIKQRNAACETLLERWAEPVTAFAWALGDHEDRRGFVWRAWRYLLENHPHDSICGCSIDQVHDEMRTRFDWCEQIGELMADEGLASVAQRVNTAALGDGGAPFVVFNPTTGPRNDVVQFEMTLPGPADDLDLLDDAGEPVPFEATEEDTEDLLTYDLTANELVGMLGYVEGGQVMGLTIQDLHLTVDGPDAYLELPMIEGGEPDPVLVTEGLARIRALIDGGEVETFHIRAYRSVPSFITFVARDVPGIGYRAYRFARGVYEEPPAVWDEEAEARIENEYFVVEADPDDGTLIVTDKRTGYVYEGLNGFLDEGDAGDEYNYCPPSEDRFVDVPAEPPSIATYRDAAGQSLVIEMVYDLPVSLTEDRQSRADETVPCRIETEVALWAGVRRIDVSTTVDNQARDHRLRVHFPAGIHADTSWADGHFCAVERPVDLPTDTADWVEQPIGTHPQRAWCDVGDGAQSARGLMIANRGLYEYEAFNDEDDETVLVLTLLRCVGWLSRADIAARPGHAGPGLPTPGAQSIGEHSFDYSIIPHAGTWSQAEPEARAFAAPLRAVPAVSQDGPLPVVGHLLEIEPAALVASAVKRSEDGQALVVRLVNNSAEALKGRVRLGVPCQRNVQRVNLDEDATDLPLLADADGWVSLAARAWEIITLRFVPSPME
ncbi:MAG: hypothetical protein KKA73_04190 [Chloroflexi bacterium]|nr:hypothetical protein [Chloroflexota bacterium]MBU1746866.1 hypothetical protein [Chloroflexota bacterium]MBU1878469.1 hypothetical protein [Chloroflexota bacterium]